MFRSNQHLLGFARFLAFAVSGLLVLDASRAAEPDAASVRITNTQEHFSFALPAGWREMSPELVAILVDPPKERQNGGGVFAYELAASSNSLALPWVTIQVMRRGKIAGGYIAMLRSPEVRRRATLDMLEGRGVAKQDVDEIGFDTNRFMLRFKTTRSNQDGVRVSALEGLSFTELGSITITCMAEAENYPKWAGVFSSVLDSFEVDPAVQYRREPVNLAGAKFRASTVLLIPAIMIVVGLLRIFSKRFSGQVMSDEI